MAHRRIRRESSASAPSPAASLFLDTGASGICPRPAASAPAYPTDQRTTVSSGRDGDCRTWGNRGAACAAAIANLALARGGGRYARLQRTLGHVQLLILDGPLRTSPHHHHSSSPYQLGMRLSAIRLMPTQSWIAWSTTPIDLNGESLRRNQRRNLHLPCE